MSNYYNDDGSKTHESTGVQYGTIANVDANLWSDHDLVEYVHTSKEREAKEKEIQERRYRLRDPFDVKYALSRVKGPRHEIAEQFDKLDAIVNSAKKDLSPSENVALYTQNGVVCPYCKRFRHWNATAFSQHQYAHEEEKFLKEALWKARSRYDYLKNVVTGARQTIKFYNNNNDSNNRNVIQAREQLADAEKSFYAQFDEETLRIMDNY